MSTGTTLTPAWARGTDDDYVTHVHGHDLTVYPPSPTGLAFWFVTTPAGDEIATGFADTLAAAKDDAVTAVHQDLRLWDL